jgi:DNA-binding PadR family transcriptional regulator
MNTMDQTLSELGRFAEPAILILTSLAGGPKHGYAIMDDVVALAGFRMGPGTLYGALARLERLGYITSLSLEERRRPYMLTPSGEQILRVHLTNMQQFASLGLARLGGVA